MALLDLASHADESFACTDIVIALDRINLSEAQQKQSIRDLGWVGLKLVALDEWLTGLGAECNAKMSVRSERWTFLGMEL